jgi:hypothetical protein
VLELGFLYSRPGNRSAESDAVRLLLNSSVCISDSLLPFPNIETDIFSRTFLSHYGLFLQSVLQTDKHYTISSMMYMPITCKISI